MLNKVIMQGRLTRDPESKQTSGGINYCQFTIACDRGDKDRNVDFFDCVAWRGTADLVSKYLTKGRMILVEGRMDTRKYQDKAGNNRTAYSIQTSAVHFCDSKKDTESAAPASAVPEMTPLDDEDDGELPF